MAVKPTIPAHARGGAKTHITPLEAKKYTDFSQLTTGAFGRRVKIKASLIFPFLSAVDPGSHDGQTIIRQIEGLRSTAGQLKSRQNANSAFDHMLAIKHVQVFYRVMQVETGEKNCVYITNIKNVYKGEQEAACLYEIISPNGQLRTKKLKTKRIPEFTVYINGSAPNLEFAVKESQVEHSLVRPLAIFYNPAQVINGLGIWKSNNQSNVSRAAAIELASIIKSNQSTAKKTYWSAEGEGASLLAEALKSVSGKLENQQFRLINPVADTPALLKSLTDKQALLGAEPINFMGKDNRTAYIALLSHKEELVSTMKDLPVKRSHQNARDELMGHFDCLGKGFSTSTKPSLSKTFLDVLREAGKRL